VRTPGGHRLLACLLFVGTLVAVPASASAAVTLGSSLAGSFQTSGPCPTADGCAAVQQGLPGRATAAPFDGVVVRFRVRGHGGVRLFVARYTAQDTVLRVATGAAVSATSLDTIRTFPTRLSIRAGESVGVMSEPGFEVGVRQFPGADADVFIPPPSTTTPTPAPGPDGPFEVSFSADVERDADHDGFGDETQDRCPKDAATQAPCVAAAPPPPLDTAPPRLLGRPRATRAVRYGSHRRPLLRFRLSERARVTFTVLRRTRGRAHAAARYLPVGRFRKRAHPGLNRVRVPARLRGQRLRPGRYRVLLSARDAAGNRSRLAQVGFRILPPLHRHRRHR
jgi:hypothetical protein